MTTPSDAQRIRSLEAEIAAVRQERDSALAMSMALQMELQKHRARAGWLRELAVVACWGVALALGALVAIAWWVSP